MRRSHSEGLLLFSPKSCLTLCDPKDCSPKGSSDDGISQTRILEWVAISFSREFSWPRDQTPAFCLAANPLPLSHLGSPMCSLWYVRWIPKNIYFSLTDYAKAFDCLDYNKLWKILKEMEIPDHLTCLLRNLYAGQETTELDLEEHTNSKLEKEYVKAVCCYPAYLTYMKSEMPGWMNYKLESRLKVKVAQSCPTLCDPMDYTVHGILQARIMKWVTLPFSRGSSQPKDRTQVSHIPGGFFTSWTTREAQSQDCWEKHQQPQVCRCYHSNDRKWRGIKETVDEDERGE